jgi:hypothetical protein
VVDLDPKGKHGARVRLAPDWRERLDDRREAGGEFARARRQALKHRLDRLGYLDRGEADPTPELMGPERVAEILEAHCEEWSRQHEETETPGAAQAKAASLAEKVLANLGTVRYGLLRDVWEKDQNEREIDLRRALRDSGYPLRPHDEHPGELWVYPAKDRPAPVQTPKSEPVLATVPEASENWRNHPLDCDCDDCASPMPTYVSLGREKNDRIPLARNHAGAGDPGR